jgi:succinate dehydrogenase/fumarate reductase flavoprotein subunit
LKNKVPLNVTETLIGHLGDATLVGLESLFFRSPSGETGGIVFKGKERLMATKTASRSNLSKVGVARMETDVLVVGAGIGGYVAAAEAAGAGVRVIMLEKMKNVLEAPPGLTGARGNDTAKSGGGWGALFPYPFPENSSMSRILKAGMKDSRGRAFPELCKAFWSRLNDDFFWLKDQLKLPLKDRSTAIRPHTYVTIGKGPKTARFGLEYAKKKGVTILYRHKATKLLSDNYGRIIGIRVMTPKGLKDFMAKAIILATGGFQGNDEMKLRYLGRELTVGAPLTGSPWNTGDGHLMAKEVGAKMVNMDSVHTRWCTEKRGINPHRNIGVYGIYINQSGKRYVDEAGASNETSLLTAYQPKSICALLIDERIKNFKIVFDAIKTYRLEKSGELMRADTLGTVARKINVNANVLKKTVQDFNAAVHPKKRTAPGADPPKGIKRTTAYRIEKAPYYFLYPVFPGLNHTTGGPLINEKCEVLNNDDQVISGLYAVGALAFGFMDGLYHITEMVSGLELSLTLGRVAGEKAAAYARGQEA